jgi:hypothetical protein
MKTRYVAVLFLAVGLSSCGKDKFQTIPQLKFISKNTDVVAQNGTLRVTLQFTDKEGDVNDSLLVVRQRINRSNPVTPPASPYSIPNFPASTKGEFDITLTYQFGLIFGISPIRIPGSNPARNEPDTLNLKFVARDRAGNKSDTLTLRNIIVIR